MTTAKRNKQVRRTGSNNVYPRRHPVKRRRRRLRKGALVVIAFLIAAVVLAFTLPGYLTSNKLRNLGYSQSEIKQIKKMKLTDTILENQYYSPQLAAAIEDGTVRTEYLQLYTVLPENRAVTDSDFLLYGRLLDHEYEEDQILNLFSALEFREMVPLLLMDYQWDENPYIKDCVDNRGTNINGTFALSGSYRTTYKITSETDKTDSVSVLVNQKYYLPSSFTPEQLTDIDSQYAVPDMRLAKPAADALQDLCQAGISNDHPFYVTVSYRSWDDQNDYYQDIAESAGEEEADRNALRAGFSEHQTGLAVNFAATYETDVSFEESDVCKWLVENSSNYGWIQRYPAGLEYITGIGDEPEHFRYLGRDLAKAVQESGLSYDEYYCLYLRGWENESFKPAADILTSVSYYSQSETTEQPAQTDSAAAQETAEPEVTEETTAETPSAEETTEEAQ